MAAAAATSTRFRALVMVQSRMSGRTSPTGHAARRGSGTGARHGRPRTFIGYQTVVEYHLIPALGDIRLTRLQPDDVDRLLRQKSASGLSPRRVAIIRAVLRRALGQALKRGIVARNVAALVDPPKQIRHEVGPLSPEECQRLLEQVREDRLEALYIVALATGLRQGELLALQWSDIGAGTITVRRTRTRVADGSLGFAQPKSETSRRTVALPSIAVEALRSQRVHQIEKRLALGAA